MWVPYFVSKFNAYLTVYKGLVPHPLLIVSIGQYIRVGANKMRVLFFVGMLKRILRFSPPTLVIGCALLRYVYDAERIRR